MSDGIGYVVCTKSGAPATGRYASIEEAAAEVLMLNTLDGWRRENAAPFQVCELVPVPAPRLERYLRQLKDGYRSRAKAVADANGIPFGSTS